MTANQHPKVGELRPTQIMFSFGIGAIVDLPYISVIVMGLDDWRVDPATTREISEDRLLQAVREQLGHQVQKLLSPPAMPETPGTPNPFDEAQRVGVPVATFPRWMVCPICRRLIPMGTQLLERKDYPYHPDRTQYVHANCDRARKPPTVVPARFLVACENGHLDDFPWVEFVHHGPTTCPSLLRLIERGPTGEARDIEVRCDTCNKGRPLSHAFGAGGQKSMPQCRGRRPHLRDFDEHPCDQRVKALLLGASNLWFPDVLTTLAIPSSSDRLAQLVVENWAVLQLAPSANALPFARQLGHLASFTGYSDTEIWQAVQTKRRLEKEGEPTGVTDLKEPEWNLLTHPDGNPASEDFRLRGVSVPAALSEAIARVVLVERMREVRALVGFTRIDAPGELGEPSLAVSPRSMRISRSDPAWVPAAEVRGEGIFIQFSEEQIQRWLAKAAVQGRDHEFFESHCTWRDHRSLKPREANYPGLRFVLLHSFAHALMRQFALECGYTGASVRERIYSRNVDDPDFPGQPMAGVLIYTAAPDSEGTLGGLVSLGEPSELVRHVVAGLKNAGLCASDPLCAENVPGSRGATLHAAACHACMFVPETSCERGNKYLDRSLLVATVERNDLAFFEVPE